MPKLSVTNFEKTEIVWSESRYLVAILCPFCKRVIDLIASQSNEFHLCPVCLRVIEIAT